MVEAENHELHWYALKVFYNKVFAVEEELTADGTECYVPVEETVVERGGQRRKVRRPVINSLMFFRAAEERAVAVQRQLTDRAILYTRLMRDLLGLDCLLVYYPGHLAAAVAFTEGTPTGDYLLLDGRRYFVTDGTSLGYGASVGTTMTGMDNAGAKVIRLDATR